MRSALAVPVKVKTYAVHRSKDDPHVFWTTEVYADDDAFPVHRASEVHAAASPVSPI